MKPLHHRADRDRSRPRDKTPALSRVGGSREATDGPRHANAREQRANSHSRPDSRERSEHTAIAEASRNALRSEQAPRPGQGNPGPRQATSEDFLAAAAANAPAHHRIRKNQPRDSPAPEHHSALTGSTARPLSVVSIIRPAAQRPQLPSIAQAVEEPVILPTVIDTRGRLIMPPPLRGSREILLRQNQLASDEGLGRVQDDTDLDAMRRKGMLVAVPVNASLRVDDRLPANRRFCRPWTAQFLATLAHAHDARFHTPLQLNSAVRTVAFQQHLLRINGNAAPADGDTASPHLTGQAVDLAKRGLSLTEIAWLRGYLLPFIEAGRIDVEEEFRQSCFHISVYRQGNPPAAGADRYTVASRGLTPALATTLP